MALPPGFDPQSYMRANTDVYQAVQRGEITPEEHYLTYGQNEGRSITAPENWNWQEDQYLRLNPDVQSAVQSGSLASGLDHYNKFGKFEDRMVNNFEKNTSINPYDYFAANADVANSDFSAGDHYAIYGNLENRDLAPTPETDPFDQWNSKFTDLYSTLNDAASQFSSGLQQQQQAQQQSYNDAAQQMMQQQQAQQQSYNDAAQQMMQQFQQMQQMQGGGTYSPTGQNTGQSTSQYTAGNWSNPFNQTSTLPAQYQANTGNAQNGFAPNWLQSNPFNLPTY